MMPSSDSNPRARGLARPAGPTPPLAVGRVTPPRSPHAGTQVVLDQVVEAAHRRPPANRREVRERMRPRSTQALRGGVRCSSGRDRRPRRVRPGRISPKTHAMLERDVAASTAGCRQRRRRHTSRSSGGTMLTIAGTPAAFAANQGRALAVTETPTAKALTAASTAAAEEDAGIEAVAEAAVSWGDTKSHVGGGAQEAAELRPRSPSTSPRTPRRSSGPPKGDGAANLRASGPATADAIRNQGREAAARSPSARRR